MSVMTAAPRADATVTEVMADEAAALDATVTEVMADEAAALDATVAEAFTEGSMKKRTDCGRIGCILMASGSSVRFGRNKLMEKLDGREIILHTAGNLTDAGFSPLAVTRSDEIKELMDRQGISCILHDGVRKSDTMRAGILHLDPDPAGYLFMPADQPLVLPASLRRLAEQFQSCPSRAVRLGFERTAGSPVLFPAFCRDDLLAYTGDRGGMDVLKQKHLPCDIVQAASAWELWDVDTPEKMEMVKNAYFRYRACIGSSE